MCNFCSVEVLQGTPLDIRNKVAGWEQAWSFSEPVSLHATAAMILKDAEVMRSEAGATGGLNKKKLMHDMYIKAGKNISANGTPVCFPSPPPPPSQLWYHHPRALQPGVFAVLAVTHNHTSPATGGGPGCCSTRS